MHFVKAVIIISTNHESFFALFSASLPENFHFFKAGVERNTSKEVCLQECFTRRVYYIVYVYTTLQQGPMLPLRSYVHFIFHVQIKLRHTMLSAFYSYSHFTTRSYFEWIQMSLSVSYIGRRLLKSLLVVAGIKEETEETGTLTAKF